VDAAHPARRAAADTVRFGARAELEGAPVWAMVHFIR